ncbi:hypothetical protein [Marinigracilibium pacificum]|uniref:Uncharacterized protein n=1 Tax=Marinigracilibium pacificum TaxID=2729599 RepID=A0A848IV43_9BACT|nr:hypothetical protein [Marinigracilibium pacificum]NMM47101.1 hypothetical protein [Marinigracilibium pacificum]
MKLKLLITVYFCIVSIFSGLAQSEIKTIYQKDNPPLSVRGTNHGVFILEKRNDLGFNLSVYSLKDESNSEFKIDNSNNLSVLSFKVFNSEFGLLLGGTSTSKFTAVFGSVNNENQYLETIDMDIPDGFTPEELIFDGVHLYCLGSYLNRKHIILFQNNSFVFVPLVINDLNQIIDILSLDEGPGFVLRSYIKNQLIIYSSKDLREPYNTLIIDDNTNSEALIYSHNGSYAAELNQSLIRIYSNQAIYEQEIVTTNEQEGLLISGVFEHDNSATIILDRFEDQTRTKNVYERVLKNKKYEYATVKKTVFDQRNFLEKKIFRFHEKLSEPINVKTEFAIKEKTIPLNYFHSDSELTTVSTLYNSEGIAIELNINSWELKSSNKLSSGEINQIKDIESIPFFGGWLVMGNRYLYEQNNKRVYTIMFYEK